MTPYTLVDYRMQDGEESDRPEFAGSLKWDFCVKTEPYAIVAYRLHKPVKQQLPTEEQPIWSGEGLPPVGCECQYRKHKKSEQSEWFNGVVKYASECTVVIQPTCYAGETVGHPDNFEFRTIPSEEDIKRDTSIKAIFDVLAQYDSLKGCHTYEGKADYIYSAIESGKIPHISIDHTAV